MENILKRILDNIPDKYDKGENQFPYDFSKAVAIEIKDKENQLEKVKEKLNVDNLHGEELDKYIYQRTGLVRHPATYATTTVLIKGQEGASISKGDLVASDTVNFVSLEDKIIDSTGEMLVEVQCEEPGVIGNVPIGAIRYFPTTIPGLVSVINLEAVTNGYEAESDDDYRKRYYERIRTPATSGNKHHYLNWAKEVIGVGDARVIPLWDGPNTVKIIIIDSNKQPASQDLVEQVQNYIDPKGEYIAESNTWTFWGTGEGQAPIGAFCTVVSATGKAINILVTITRDTTYTLEQVKANIENNIIEYLKNIAFKQNIVSYAHIGAIVLDSEGVLDYENLLVNGGTSNILVGFEEVAVLGEVIINE